MSAPAVVGRPLARVDGPLKVSGRAPYAADFSLPGEAAAVIVQSTIAAGHVHIDAAAARQMPGVLAILTHENAPVLPARGRAGVSHPAGRVLSLLQDDEVHYNGEPIAVVVADHFVQAVDAAAHVLPHYRERAAALSFAGARMKAYAPPPDSGPDDLTWGDPEAGERAGDVRIEHVYSTPMEHHNPLEPHATLAHWDNGHLTLYDATQYVSGVRDTVAKTLGIPASRVRVVNPYVGGGFGCKGSTWSHVVLAAMAARAVERPVKLVLSRPQMFGPVGGRPQTEQRVVLAARRDGRLTAVRHDVLSHTSTMEDFVEPATQPTAALYACDNGMTTQRLVRLNVGVPTFQRAPGECTGTFALESAMDELACALAIDPVTLRLRNHADTEPASGKPWSSKHLRECYARAAARFGWTRRNPAPRMHRDGHWLIGCGMATATFPAHRLPAAASARLQGDGSVLVQSGTQDLGTGTYTIMTQIAADALGLPPAQVRFELGDTDFPAAPVSGGSMTAASVGPAVRNACSSLRARIIARAVADAASPLHGLGAAEVVIGEGWIEQRGHGRREKLGAFAARHGETLAADGTAEPGDEAERFATRSFGAVFAEVRVDDQTGVVRVPRIVAAYSVGRVLNRQTARSQLQGGIVWGVGQALFEESLLDSRYGRFVNGNLAEYHVPVNADVESIEVDFIEENDPVFTPIGARGIGEIGITGVAGALANAVYHATGRRIRSLPITLDKLL